MNRPESGTLPSAQTLWMAVGVCISVAVLAWFGYNAVREWKRSSTQLATRRVGETADLFARAIERDMHAVQTSVLSTAHRSDFMLDPPFDVRAQVASAFARYPYPETFFAWRKGSVELSEAMFFNRADRLPAWLADDPGPNRFPVSMGTSPKLARLLIDRILRDASRARPFSAFETTIDGIPYQIIVHLVYSDPLGARLEAVFGCMVNLAWVREHYFSELTQQVQGIGRVGEESSLLVLDDRGRVVAGSHGADRIFTSRRSFPLMFFDPVIIALDPPRDLPRVEWAVEVGARPDPAVEAAINGADRVLVVAAVSAATLALALVLTAHVTRAKAQLAEMRSDFVSTVTHELKTPLATIRAAGDTLASGRISSPDALRDYAQLVVQESKRLTRLFDNLLAYARITDVTEAYSFEPLLPSSIIGDALQRFETQLTCQGFAVDVEVAPDVPPVRADRTAMELLWDNLVDNAIRYSRDTRAIRIAARRQDNMVCIELADRGMGIPAHELGHVTRRFFRGRRAGSGGSGLGLAIARRIVADHDGALTIDSTVDAGTTVTVTLPIADESDEEADSDR